MVSTMPARKTAITIPEALLVDVDRAARERGESRSRYITRVLQVAVWTRRDAEITHQLDALFAEEGARGKQSRGAHDLDGAGSDWTEERW
jgi:hypothetical protein